MDVKVYKKEEVLQPSGTEYVYVPDVIDIIPNIVTNPDTGEEIITGAVELEDSSKDLLEQEGLHISKYRTTEGRMYHIDYEEPSLENE